MELQDLWVPVASEQNDEYVRVDQYSQKEPSDGHVLIPEDELVLVERQVADRGAGR